jgi:hypothetical protein
MANSPAEITVIYPMIELRGDPTAPLRSWTREQTLARERYRVIAVFAEADRAQAAAMEPLLGPNDELLPVPEPQLPGLDECRQGARPDTVADDDRRTLHCAARRSR